MDRYQTDPERKHRDHPTTDERDRLVLRGFGQCVNGFQSLLFNNATGPTKDIRIRRAVAYALDKNGARSQLDIRRGCRRDAGAALVLLGLRPCAAPDALPSHRVEAAAGAAGYGPEHRLSLELYYDESSVLNKTLSVQIQSMLAPLGIDVHAHAQLSSIIYGGYGANGTIARGLYEMALEPYTSGIDPDDSDEFTCASMQPNGSNDSYFCNAAMDAAQKDALQTYDRPSRKATYARVQKGARSECPG